MNKLSSPFPTLNEDGCEYVHAKIPRDTFNYFFRHVLAGHTGCRQSLIQTFFFHLHQQCLKENIPPVYDPANESRVADIVANLNFAASGGVPRPERSVRAGRTDKPTPVDTKQSPTHSRKRGRTSGNGPKAPHVGESAGDDVGKDIVG